MIESLGGADYELEDEFTSQEVSGNDKPAHRSRSLVNKERLKAGVELGIMSIALFLGGCVPAGTDAYTTPFGIVYNIDNPPQELINHEECHQERAQSEGLAFWLNYTISPEFRCEEEKRCGAIEHPYCE